MRALRLKLRRFSRSLKNSPYWVLIAAIIFTALVAIVLSLYHGHFTPFAESVIPEVWGLSFDIALFAILFLLFEKKLEGRQDIRRHRREIETFRFWQVPEASYRHRASIRALNDLGVYDIDINSCIMASPDEWKKWHFRIPSSYQLPKFGIHDGNLDGVTLLGGRMINWTVTNSHCVKGNFERCLIHDCVFSYVRFEDCTFSGSTLSDSKFEHCSFIHCHFTLLDDPIPGHKGTTELQDCEFIGCDFGDSDFDGTLFFGGKLINCTLTRVRNLTYDQLTGGNHTKRVESLKGSWLPNGFEHFSTDHPEFF